MVGAEVVAFLSANARYLWLLLGAVLIISVVLTAVYFYHWRRYGMSPGVVTLVETIYLAVMASLFLVAGLALLFA